MRSLELNERRRDWLTLCDDVVSTSSCTHIGAYTLGIIPATCAAEHSSQGPRMPLVSLLAASTIRIVSQTCSTE